MACDQAIIGGLAFQFTRRRYGSKTYCWAVVRSPGGTLIDLGDPWPGVKWPRKQLLAEAKAAIAKGED